MNSDDKLKQTIKDHAPKLLALPGVTGVAIGETDQQEPCIMVLALVVTSELREALPSTLDGFPVRLVESGEIKPL